MDLLLMHRITFFIDNWKLVVHLLLRTKRFGVNNRWWNDFDSHFGLPLHKVVLRIVLIYPLIYEFYCMKFRAVHCYFLSTPEQELFNWNKRNTPGALTLMVMRNPIVMFKRIFRKGL